MINVRIRGQWSAKIDGYEYLEAEYPDIPLYHWAPSARWSLIQASGLLPSQSPVVEIDYLAPWVHFADTPSMAWALSAGMGTWPSGSYDLWQTNLLCLEDPHIVPALSRATGIQEVRTPAAVSSSDLWYVGSRTKK